MSCRPRRAALRLCVLVICLGLGLLCPPAPALSTWDVTADLSVASYRGYLDTQLQTHNGDNRGFQLVSGSYVPTADHDAARDAILAHYAALGLEASLDPFTFTYDGKSYACQNVLGVLPGRVHPERIYVIGGHYDSAGNPGADDNASGVAGVMEAARVLSAYAFESTILFAAWDGEEKGLWGSYHWVDTFDEAAVQGVVNLDMIAYNRDADGNGRGDNKAMIYGKAGWREQWQAAAGRYAPDITVTVNTNPQAFSDHWPFENGGRPAAGIIEYNYSGNPHYHKQTDSFDTAGYIDCDYAVKLLATGVGLIAEEAGLLLSGDADRDGDVDVLDYLALKANYGASPAGWAACDFTADGAVDRQDLLALRDHLGEALTPGPSAAAAAAAVPEPATLFLLLAPGALAVVRRFRRRPCVAQAA